MSEKNSKDLVEQMSTDDKMFEKKSTNLAEDMSKNDIEQPVDDSVAIGQLPLYNWTIESRLEMLEGRMMDAETRLVEIVQQLNATPSGGSKRDIVTQTDFEDMVHDCISKGHSLGCSKIFIRRFLCEHHGQSDNRYVRRRLNAVLKNKVDSGHCGVFHSNPNERIDETRVG